jgi:hypothetical protein
MSLPIKPVGCDSRLGTVVGSLLSEERLKP